MLKLLQKYEGMTIQISPDNASSLPCFYAASEYDKMPSLCRMRMKKEINMHQRMSRWGEEDEIEKPPHVVESPQDQLSICYQPSLQFHTDWSKGAIAQVSRDILPRIVSKCTDL